MHVMGGYVALLRVRSFRLLWLGDTASSLGDSVGFLALIWLVYSTAGSAATLGGFIATYTAPVLLGGPLVGAALDRFDRRRLLIVDSVFRGGLVLLIPVLHVLGVLQIWELYVFAFAYGLLKMIPLAGVPTLIPDLAPADALEAANALESVTFFLASVVGAALAGVLIAAVGGANALWIDAASYAVFAFALWRIGPIDTDPEQAHATSAPFREALHFVLSTPIILATTLMFMSVNIGSGAIDVIVPVYVKRVLHAGPATYGALVSVAAAAGLVGALVGGGLRGVGLGRAIAACEIVAGLAYAGFAGRPSIAPTFAVFALAALCLGPLTVWAQTIRMRLIPAAMRGRVFGVLRTSMQGTVPLGALIAPVLLRGGMGVAGLTVAALLVVPAFVALAAGALETSGAQASIGT